MCRTLPYDACTDRREGINIFLAGFVPTENLRFREESLTFKVGGWGARGRSGEGGWGYRAGTGKGSGDGEVRGLGDENVGGAKTAVVRRLLGSGEAGGGDGELLEPAGTRGAVVVAIAHREGHAGGWSSVRVPSAGVPAA